METRFEYLQLSFPGTLRDMCCFRESAGSSHEIGVLLLTLYPIVRSSTNGEESAHPRSRRGVIAAPFGRCLNVQPNNNEGGVNGHADEKLLTNSIESSFRYHQEGGR